MFGQQEGWDNTILCGLQETEHGDQIGCVSPSRVDDSLDLLAKSNYFSTLDLASGYWQVSIAPESVEKTVFITHSGLYESAVMLFSLCNAPATFQRLMEAVLAGLAQTLAQFT